MTLKFRAFRDYVRPLMANPDVYFHPGPDDPDVSGAFVKLTRVGGAGLEVEGLVDMVEWQVESVGDQNDYDQAEDMADTMDQIVLGMQGKQIGGTKVISAWRTGSAPAPLLVDDAQRHHFACSYTLRVQSGLAA